MDANGNGYGGVVYNMKGNYEVKREMKTNSDEQQNLMMRKTTLTALFFAGMLAVLVLVGTGDGAMLIPIITVDDSGGADYTSIQAAIDAANPGDTIFVFNGTYYENVWVNKQITLMGEGADVVTVQPASASWNVFVVSADYVNLSGFNVEGAPGSGATGAPVGILLTNVVHCVISNNIISYTASGIRVISSSNNIVSSNNISNCYWGIFARSSSNNVIGNNDISATYDSGVFLWQSQNNTITSNTITKWEGSSSYRGGIHLDASSNNKIDDNIFVNDGIIVRNSYTNTMENNTVNDKPIIYLEDIFDYTVVEAGQVILVNCSNIVIKNLDLSGTIVPIQLLKTTGSQIENNTITASGNSLCYFGLFMRLGIYLEDSSGNTLIRNKGSGICSIYSSNNTIADNTFLKSGIIVHSYPNKISLSFQRFKISSGGKKPLYLGSISSLNFGSCSSTKQRNAKPKCPFVRSKNKVSSIIRLVNLDVSPVSSLSSRSAASVSSSHSNSSSYLKSGLHRIFKIRKNRLRGLP